MNFFVTGNDCFKAGIDLEFIASAESHGKNFADKGQTLIQSFSIAQEIFGRIAYGKIDFVLIGLAPDVLFRDDNDKFSADAFDKNLTALNDYIKLCLNCGAKPVGVILPFAPGVRDGWRKKFLTPLREIIAEFQKLYDFTLVDLFDFPLDEKVFSDETHLDMFGAARISVALTSKLYEQKIFPFEDFCRLSYDYFAGLSLLLEKNTFHNLLEKIYRSTTDKLRLKTKIKVAFVTDNAAVWCGDKLYNLFARNPRFETTIFFCRSTETDLKNFRHDLEQLKSRGLNVVSVSNLNEETLPQDVVIFLRPYYHNFSKSFQPSVMTPQTLFTYIHYAFETITTPYYYNYKIFRLAWKFFFGTEPTRRLFDQNCAIGVPRGLVSGLPKMDSFFDVPTHSFKWKMLRPDAKKIIWAPHWSLEGTTDSDLLYSTFQYNFRFMYEFAKNHPETSWVLKPHPRLAHSAVKTKLFAATEAFENYLRAWDELPNAQVVTGGYYQEIFATSDGLIHDCNSFIAEYQFTHKPMIFLTRDNPSPFTELGNKILNVSYRVNGKNLTGIAELVRKIFIEGNDPLKAERRKVFDELLDYRRINGISASEFVFKSIADELGA